jgi:hypothetical protein
LRTTGCLVTSRPGRPFPSCLQKADGHHGRSDMSILWIILIVVVVLALFGFIGRGFW